LNYLGIHPAESVSLLEPAYDDPYPGQRIDPSPVIVEGNEECLVEEILDARIDKIDDRILRIIGSKN
jgi:hypothetical protein